MIGKETIWPARRDFLKRTPLLFGGLALASMPKVAKAFANAGGSFRQAINPPAQPPIALTYSYNTCTFFDDFDSLASIDVNNTLKNRYKWYMQDIGYPTAVMDPSSLSVNNSIITINPTPGIGNPSYINTIAYLGASASPRQIGTLIAPTGGYFECSMGFDKNGSSGGLRFPAFWMADARQQVEWIDCVPNTRYAELDFVEWGDAFTINDWVGCNVAWENTNNFRSVGSPDFSQQHKYGCLWVPQSKNGGTGMVKYYFDRVEVAGSGFTYSSSTVSPQAQPGAPTGVFSTLDTSTGYYILIGSGHGWPINVDYVQVWQ